MFFTCLVFNNILMAVDKSWAISQQASCQQQIETPLKALSCRNNCIYFPAKWLINLQFLCLIKWEVIQPPNFCPLLIRCMKQKNHKLRQSNPALICSHLLQESVLLYTFSFFLLRNSRWLTHCKKNRIKHMFKFTIRARRFPVKPNLYP